MHIVDSFGNNLIHLAAKYESTQILAYLVENTRINAFERNEKGETALSIAQDKKN